MALSVSSLPLKMTFYAITGVLLAAITWSTIAHSAVTGDYLISFILLGMMFYIVGQFCVDRWYPEEGLDDLGPRRLWRLPERTTSHGLWLRVGFHTLLNVGVYSILSCILVLITTARVESMLLLGSLFLLRAPHLYWSLRGRYARATSRDGTLALPFAKPTIWPLRLCMVLNLTLRRKLESSLSTVRTCVAKAF